MISKVINFLFHHTHANQVIAKNTIWLGIGQFGARAMRGVLIIVAARLLGVENWGIFAYILGIVTLLTVIADLGIGAFVTKEIARDSSKKELLIINTFILKLILIVVFGIITIPFVPLIAKFSIPLPLLLFIALTFAFDALRDFASAVARGMQRMEIEAASLGVTNFLITIFGITSLWYRPTIFSLALAYVLGTTIGSLITFWWLRKSLSIKIIVPRLNTLKEILRVSWPFGLMSVLGIIMLNTDTLMLGWLSNAYAIGLYTSSQRIIQMLYAIPAILATALFPTLSRQAHDNQEQFTTTLKTGLQLQLLLAGTIMIVGIFYAPEIISLAFGSKYLPSLSTFIALLFTLPIVFPSILLTNALFAKGKRKTFIWFFALGAGSNIIGNALLIPSLGITGCALATLLSQMLSNFLYFKILVTDLHISIREIFKKPIITVSLLFLINIAVLFLGKYILHLPLPSFLIGGLISISIAYLAGRNLYRNRTHLKAGDISNIGSDQIF